MPLQTGQNCFRKPSLNCIGFSDVETTSCRLEVSESLFHLKGLFGSLSGKKEQNKEGKCCISCGCMNKHFEKGSDCWKWNVGSGSCEGNSRFKILKEEERRRWVW